MPKNPAHPGAVSIGGEVRFDLPRNSQQTALLGDHRNDENLIVSQLHLAQRVVRWASRSLLRGLTMKVPSGQAVAKAMKLPILAPGDLDDLKSFHLSDRTPLWFYVLREADVVTDGQHLGPVGGRIVAEVIVGLVRGDHQSYLRQAPEWKPTYSSGGSFTIVDLLRAADVVAAPPLSGAGTGPEHGWSGPGAPP